MCGGRGIQKWCICSDVSHSAVFTGRRCVTAGERVRALVGMTSIYFIQAKATESLRKAFSLCHVAELDSWITSLALNPF